MSLIVQTIIIGVIALIVHFFSPIVAGWIIWGSYLVFAVVLLTKGLDDRKRLSKGEEGIDTTSAAWLPAGMIGVLIILAIFLLYPFNKFHLLWAVNMPVLLVEFIGSRKIYKKELNFINKLRQNKDADSKNKMIRL